MADFVHLHLHSEFSLLDGLGKIDQYVARAVEYGMPAAALTDHGVLYGALDWHNACRRAGVKPIVGVEAYYAPNGVEARDKHQHHLLLLAENETGYRNLLWLASMASLKGFYYRPRVDKEMLAGHHEGIVALTACLGGEVPSHLMAGEEARARESLGQLRDIFGRDHVFIELMDHGMHEQASVNEGLLRLQRQFDLPLVATNDVHYVDQGDAYAQDVLVCIQTGVTVQDEKRLKMASDQLYFKRPEEMLALFSGHPEAVRNTLRVAEMCDLRLDHQGYHLPHFPVPEGFTQESYLEHVCRAGCLQRYGCLTEEVERRLVYELSVIGQMGFASYFLVVWDFVRFARERGILVGPGRGSAAGSLVVYSLGITGLDPLKHHLIFERFLNPSRVTMPDIDLDFQDDRRGEVIEYVTRKYGEDRVAQIITFGTLAAKAAVRDVGRALGMPLNDVDRVARLVPTGPNVSLEEALKVPELQSLYAGDATVRDLIDLARKLEGVSRHASTHAAGVVISRDPLVQHVPVQRAGKTGNEVTTQYHMGLLEEIGLLKMDFLGLSTLSIIGRACAYARQTHGIELLPESIPLDDEATYEIFRRGETLAIFQLEGGMATRMTVDVAPTGFDDVVALMALVRPGPMELAPVYIARKHGREPIEYMHPAMEPILSETFGVPLYQEQVMQIAKDLAGYSMADADKLRKAMGKKLPEEMAKQRSGFIEGCARNDIGVELATRIFEMIEAFAGYGFPKAHSAAYAVIGVQTAYLKRHYPAEFMAAVLTTETGNTDKIISAVAECRRMGIPVRPPSVNESDLAFTVHIRAGGVTEIRYGLGAIKNVGEGVIQAILAARAEQPDRCFTSLDHLCSVVEAGQLNRRVLESLIKAGACDCIGPRAALLEALDKAMAMGQAAQRASKVGQLGLFGAAEAAPTLGLALPDVPPLPERLLLTWEKECLGIYVSAHPLTNHHRPPDAVSLARVTAEQAGQRVRVLAMVTGVRRLLTKKNQTMAIVTIEDQDTSAELILFPESHDRYGDLLDGDAVLDVLAKVELRNEQVQLVAERVAPAAEVADESERRRLHIRLPRTASVERDIEIMHAVSDLLRAHEGDASVWLHVPAGSGERVLVPVNRGVEVNDILLAELRRLLDHASVWLETVSATDAAVA